MKRFNPKFFLILIAICVVLAGGAYALRKYQVKRNARLFLAQAVQQEEEGNLQQAADLYLRYLAYAPADNNALAKYGLLLKQVATNPKGPQPAVAQRAFLALTQVRRRDPGRQDIVRPLAELAMQVGQFTDAEEHLDALLKLSPNDGELEALYARCEEGRGQYKDAVPWFEKAIQHAPAETANYVRLADLLRRRLDQPEKAAKVMDDLVKANPKSFRAYMARAGYRRDVQLLVEAAKDLASARQLAPHEPEVLLAASDVARAQDKLDDARKDLQEGIKQHPQDVRFYETLSALEQQAGRREDAVACLRKGLEAIPNEKSREMDRRALLFNLCELLIQENTLKEAEDKIRDFRKQLDKEGVPPVLGDYLAARLKVEKREWVEGATALETVRPQLARSPELTMQINLLLARCYSQLQAYDQQLIAYRRALEVDPLFVAGRVSLAGTLLTLGRTDEALAEYKRLTTLRNPPPSSWTMLATVQILRNLRLPSQQRDWQEVNETLNQATKAAPEDARVPVLRAEVLAAQGQSRKARELLEKAKDKHPKEPAFWIALANLTGADGKPGSAEAILKEARQQAGDLVELRLAELGQLSKSDNSQARKCLADLEQSLGKLDPADQVRVVEGLANAYSRLSDTAKAKKLWTEFAKRQPNNLRARQVLFDLAVQDGNDHAMDEAVDGLYRIEGESGTLWRYGEAVRFVEQAKRGKKSNLSRARTHVDKIAQLRPTWPAPYALAAEIYALEGNPEQAIKNCQKAIAQGANQPTVIRRLVQLLLERRRYEDAFQAIRELEDKIALSSDLERLAAEIALSTEAPERGLEFAQKAADADDKDYRNHLWLGLLQSAARQKDKAEASFRRAVELGDKVPETWVMLTQFLARTGQKPAAEKVMEEAKKKLPPDQAGLALAYCYELVAPLARAEKEYEAALASKPDDALVLFNFATFHLRNRQFDKAEPFLRKLIDPKCKASKEQVSWARRVLPIELASTGNYQNFQEALTLVEKNLTTDGATPENQRAKALVLATRAEHRQEAIKLLEEENSRQPLAAHELYALARLYEAELDWPKAKDRMIGALASPGGQTAIYLASFVRDLLAHGEAAEAEIWVAKFEKIAPQSFSPIALRSLCLKAEHKNDDAAKLLKAHAKDQDADRVTVAGLLEQVGDPAAAEEAFRQAVSESGKNMPAYIGFLFRQKRADAALDLCERAWKACPPESVASAVVAGIRVAGPSETQLRRAENEILAAIQRQPESIGLLLALGDLRQLQGRFQDAEALHRQVIALDPVNVIALNNLAWLMALRGGNGVEAQELIQRAIANAGTVAALLDTRGVVNLALGKYDDAIQDLEDAVRQQATGSRYLHLARAQMQKLTAASDDDKEALRAKAADSWRKAQSLGLKPGNVHPLDRPAYGELQLAFSDQSKK
jgi:tetratricopeptide (TPR) repeat protein